MYLIYINTYDKLGKNITIIYYSKFHKYIYVYYYVYACG